MARILTEFGAGTAVLRTGCAVLSKRPLAHAVAAAPTTVGRAVAAVLALSTYLVGTPGRRDAILRADLGVLGQEDFANPVSATLSAVRRATEAVLAELRLAQAVATALATVSRATVAVLAVSTYFVRTPGRRSAVFRTDLGVFRVLCFAFTISAALAAAATATTTPVGLATRFSCAVRLANRALPVQAQGGCQPYTVVALGPIRNGHRHTCPACRVALRHKAIVLVVIYTHYLGPGHWLAEAVDT